MADSGSIRKANINGLSVNISGDANIAKTAKFTVEAVPHSGGNQMKFTKNSGQAESVTCIVSDAEYEILEALTDPKKTSASFPMSYTKADGSAWSTKGRINLDNYETEENKVDVTMIPDVEWQLFSA